MVWNLFLLLIGKIIFFQCHNTSLVKSYTFFGLLSGLGTFPSRFLQACIKRFGRNVCRLASSSIISNVFLCSVPPASVLGSVILACTSCRELGGGGISHANVMPALELPARMSTLTQIGPWASRLYSTPDGMYPQVDFPAVQWFSMDRGPISSFQGTLSRLWGRRALQGVGSCYWHLVGRGQGCCKHPSV